MNTFETLTFFRGASAQQDVQKTSIKRVRKDRRPRDTPLHLHNVADEWFLKSFGVRFRSQALLVTAIQTTATAYAASPSHVFRIVPLDHYSFCWSPKVADMLQLIDATTTPDALLRALDRAGYRDDDLDAAHASGNEVMLACERYAAIPIAELGLAKASPLIIAGAYP